mmetsp:Transcript_140179/g.390850  ORF Transcript_140179/g.390850 Transcript_140179/m.390850 type:complete len:327 (-) Transcript_140179:1047-2027(-)
MRIIAPGSPARETVWLPMCSEPSDKRAVVICGAPAVKKERGGDPPAGHAPLPATSCAAHAPRRSGASMVNPKGKRSITPDLAGLESTARLKQVPMARCSSTSCGLKHTRRNGSLVAACTYRINRSASSGLTAGSSCDNAGSSSSSTALAMKGGTTPAASKRKRVGAYTDAGCASRRRAQHRAYCEKKYKRPESEAASAGFRSAQSDCGGCFSSGSSSFGGVRIVRSPCKSSIARLSRSSETQAPRNEGSHCSARQAQRKQPANSPSARRPCARRRHCRAPTAGPNSKSPSKARASSNSSSLAAVAQSRSAVSSSMQRAAHEPAARR